jgi:hypothetical protein
MFINLLKVTKLALFKFLQIDFRFSEIKKSNQSLIKITESLLKRQMASKSLHQSTIMQVIAIY